MLDESYTHTKLIDRAIATARLFIEGHTAIIPCFPLDRPKEMLSSWEYDR